MRLTLLRRVTVDRAAAHGPPFLSAASGLVATPERLFIVGDDETHLAIVPTPGDAPGKMLRLFAGDLPHEHKARKAAKPDLETLLSLPASEALPHGGLLALGSGSTEQRRRGVVLPFDANGEPKTPQVIDLTALFAAIDRTVPETNIEGAIVRGDEIILFNRGNKTNPETIAVGFDFASVTASAEPNPKWRQTIRLPTADGVPLTITDACLLDDGSILVSAVAEDTSDAYNDGRVAGATFALLGPDLTLLRLDPIEPAVKVEGIHAWRDGDAIRLLAVSDADDPAVAAGLYSGRL